MYYKGKSGIVKVYKADKDGIYYAYDIETKKEMKFSYKSLDNWIKGGLISKV